MEEKNIQQEELEAKVESQEDEIVEEKRLQDEIDSLNDQYKRLQADYANYRRRTQDEKESIGLFANERMINDLIPVIDNMERALDACEDKEDSMYQGIDLVYKQFKDILSKFGVEEIEALELDFDPNSHMAVVQDSIEGVEPNKVVEVFQKGYKLGIKVLRPSMVKVSC